MNIKPMRSFFVFIMCVAIPVIVGLLTNMLVAEHVSTWYVTLRKPPFTPHISLFNTTWITIYTLMGLSLFLIYMSPESRERRKAIIMFFIQLILFAAGNIMFFKYHMIGWAMIEMYLVWIYIVRMIFAFRLVNYLAAILQFPYMFIVSYILVLTGTIWWMN